MKIKTIAARRGRPPNRDTPAGETPRRSIRISDEDWLRWSAAAKRRRTDVTALIRARMEGVT